MTCTGVVSLLCWCWLCVGRSCSPTIVDLPSCPVQLVLRRVIVVAVVARGYVLTLFIVPQRGRESSLDHFCSRMKILVRVVPCFRQFVRAR